MSGPYENALTVEAEEASFNDGFAEAILQVRQEIRTSDNISVDQAIRFMDLLDEVEIDCPVDYRPRYDVIGAKPGDLIHDRQGWLVVERVNRDTIYARVHTHAATKNCGRDEGAKIKVFKKHVVRFRRL